MGTFVKCRFLFYEYHSTFFAYFLYLHIFAYFLYLQLSWKLMICNFCKTRNQFVAKIKSAEKTSCLTNINKRQALILVTIIKTVNGFWIQYSSAWGYVECQSDFFFCKGKIVKVGFELRSCDKLLKSLPVKLAETFKCESG